MGFLENIKTEMKSSARAELLKLNRRITQAEEDLAALKSDREHLLQSLDDMGVILSDIATADEISPPAPDYANENQWHPADSLDQETADKPVYGDKFGILGDPDFGQRRKRNARREQRMNRRFNTAEANLGRSLTDAEEFDRSCESDA